MIERNKPAMRIEREARLRAALRENLRRRKAQLRARSAAPADANTPAATHDSAGIIEDKPKS